jgi:hypothetical protein
MKRLTLAAAAALAATVAFALPVSSKNDAPLITTPLPLAATAVNMPASPQASLNLCGERERMVQDLDRQFDESAVATGLVDQSAVMEIFVSPAGTWTILATGTDGLSCVLAVGEGFDAAAPRVVGVGA